MIICSYRAWACCKMRMAYQLIGHQFFRCNHELYFETAWPQRPGEVQIFTGHANERLLSTTLSSSLFIP